MKYKIFYIDDQSYALPQLIHALPKHLDYELIYVQRICDIPELCDFDLVILDFYLDKDHKTALDILQRFVGIPVISFSSSREKNIFMQQKGALYRAQKLKNIHKNIELEKVMENIFSNTIFPL